MPDLAPDDPRHGLNGYINLRCRCPRCSRAHSDYQAAARARRKRRLEEGAEVEHGSASTYQNWGCRCRPCTEANNAYQAAHRSG